MTSFGYRHLETRLQYQPGWWSCSVCHTRNPPTLKTCRSCNPPTKEKA